jgi:hypothetical protein
MYIYLFIIIYILVGFYCWSFFGGDLCILYLCMYIYLYADVYMYISISIYSYTYVYIYMDLR